MAPKLDDIMVYSINEKTFRVGQLRQDAIRPANDDRAGFAATGPLQEAPRCTAAVGARGADDTDEDTVRFTKGLVVGLSLSAVLWGIFLILGSGLVHLF